MRNSKVALDVLLGVVDEADLSDISVNYDDLGRLLRAWKGTFSIRELNLTGHSLISRETVREQVANFRYAYGEGEYQHTLMQILVTELVASSGREQVEQRGGVPGIISSLGGCRMWVGQACIK